MKHISFNLYKEYLFSNGFTLESGTNIYYDLKLKSYFFNHPYKKDKVIVNIFLDKINNDTDYVISINYGYGSPYLGYSSIKIDKREKFWKNLMIN